MTRWAPQKTDLLDGLAAEIVHNYGKGRALVAVDGFAGTAEFADDVAKALETAGHQAFRASMRNFQHTRALRYPAGSEPETGRYDVDTFRRVLSDPFRDGGTGSFVLAAFDPERDAAIEPKWMTAKADAVLIVDGAFLQTKDLRGLWNYTIWVEGAEEPAPDEAKYVSRDKPRVIAAANVDVTDPEQPRRRFTDSC
jgi:uridine kinase